MKKKTKMGVRVMFAVVSKDKAGETIQLFKTVKQVEEFGRAVNKQFKKELKTKK